MVKKLKNIINEFRYYLRLKTIFKYKLAKLGYLESGEYKIYFSEKPFLYNVREYTNVKKFTNKSSKWLELLNSSIYICNEKENFTGQAIRLVQNNKFQIYDFHKARVLTVFEDQKQMLNLQRKYLQFEGKLLLTYIGMSSLGILEKYIDCNPEYSSNENEKNMKMQYLQVANDIARMVECSNKMKLLDICGYKKKWKCDVEGINDLLNELEKRIEKRKVPQIYIHGDLHRGNILKDSKGDLYYIDIEYARDDVFFYDCFNYIYVDFVYNEDDTLMKMYLEKDVEIFSSMKKIFQAVSLEFDERDYLQYWLVFLQRRIIESVCLSYKYFRGKDYRECLLRGYLEFYDYILRRV